MADLGNKQSTGPDKKVIIGITWGICKSSGAIYALEVGELHAQEGNPLKRFTARTVPRLAAQPAKCWELAVHVEYI